MLMSLFQGKDRSFMKPFLGIAFLVALLQAKTFASNVTEIQTIEEGGNVNLTCGERNLSSISVLSWSKDGVGVLVNITSHNQSTLVLSNLQTVNGSGLYVCTVNSSVVLRRVRLIVKMREVIQVQEDVAPEEGLTTVDIIAIAIGLGLTTFLVVSILLLLYRAEKHRKEAKHVKRWQIDLKTHENVVIEDEFSRIPPPRSAFFKRTGHEPKRLPPPYVKPKNYVTDNHGIKYEVDEKEVEGSDETILQWRFTAYL